MAGYSRSVPTQITLHSYSQRFEPTLGKSGFPRLRTVERYAREMQTRWMIAQDYLAGSAVERQIRTPLLGPERNDSLWMESGQLPSLSVWPQADEPHFYELHRYSDEQSMTIPRNGRSKIRCAAETELYIISSEEDLTADIREIMESNLPPAIFLSPAKRFKLVNRDGNFFVSIDIAPVAKATLPARVVNSIATG